MGIERASVTDPALAVEPPQATHHVMTGPAGWFVDEREAGDHERLNPAPARRGSPAGLLRVGRSVNPAATQGRRPCEVHARPTSTAPNERLSTRHRP